MNINWKDCPTDEMANIILKELKRLGIEDNPLTSVYKSKRNKLATPSFTTIILRFGSWKDFIHEYTNFEYKDEMSWKEYSDEELVLIINTEIERIGGIVTSEKYNRLFNSEKAPWLRTIQLRFGSWNIFIDKYTDLTSTISINKKWCNYSREELLSLISVEFDRIGRPVSSIKYRNSYDTLKSPSLSMILRNFGSWSIMLKELKRLEKNNKLKERI